MKKLSVFFGVLGTLLSSGLLVHAQNPSGLFRPLQPVITKEAPKEAPKETLIEGKILQPFSGDPPIDGAANAGSLSKLNNVTVVGLTSILREDTDLNAGCLARFKTSDNKAFALSSHSRFNPEGCTILAAAFISQIPVSVVFFKTSEGLGRLDTITFVQDGMESYLQLPLAW